MIMHFKLSHASRFPGSIFLVSVFLLSVLLSCTDEKNVADELQAVSRQFTVEDLFEQVSKTKVESGKVLYVDFTWNKLDNSVAIQHIQQREPDFFVLETPKSSSLKLTAGPSYTVECSNGKNSWSKNCDSKLSCGTLIKECLDQGGCATICQKKIIYLGDEYNTFYVF
jgi:hypothetical protein